MVYTEFNVVEKKVIDWLQELGWKYVSSDDLRRDIEDPFDTVSLRQALKRLNPAIVQDEDADKVINGLRKLSNDIGGNKEFVEWLKGERSLILKPGEKATSIKLIDADNPHNNVFVVTNQFKFAGYQNVKPDIILMVNGIPLVNIEGKVPTRELLDYHEAIKQIRRYAKDAPQLIKYLAFVCPTDGINFKYGWITPDDYQKLFDWNNERITDPTEAAVKGIFHKTILLDLISNFIVFEKAGEKLTKKIAMQQQMAAVNKIVERVLDGDKKTGLIWHTQGSGKTLTMLFAAWKLKKLSALQNPTVLVIVDRLELETQHGKTFGNVDLPYTEKPVESTRELVNKLKKDTRQVLITTIQKFEEIDEVLSQRENVIIFVDEAHRTQYGKLGISLRNAFPNARIFGFTGTPIEKGPLGKSTFRTFSPAGETYLDKYSIKQSIRDGATVPIHYLARPQEYRLPSRVLDEEFFDKTRGLDEDRQEKVLATSARLKNALKSKDRIDKIARDIAEHFKTHIVPDGFKAQIVAVDREACALYKEAIDKYLPPEYSTVIYTPGQNDDGLLRKFHMPKEDQLNIASSIFQKQNENPRILIVTDMLLTGFDAPAEQVMYLDKPMKDHKLLQAIARTNRPFPGKEAGLIVDYVGIFENLEKALNFEEKDIEGVAYKFDELKKEFTKTLSAMGTMFAGIGRDDSRELLFKAFGVLDDEKNLKEFKAKLSKAKRLYETIAPDPFLKDYLPEYTWLIEVNEGYNKLQNRKKGVDLSDYQEKTKQLIKDKLLLDKIEVVLPTFEIDKHYLKSLDNQGYTREQKVMDMKRALEHHIRINIQTNPIFETLSQRLDRILKKRNDAEMLAELETMAKEVAEIEEKTKELGVTKEEYALLNVAKKYESGVAEKDLIPFVKQLTSRVKTKTFSGWQKNSGVVKEVESVVFDACFERFSPTGMKTDRIASLTDELMKFVANYND
ncbi:MAG TPA: HsdR family type I site-specific deoxyribonuclease [Candidatus Bathyarchaeia archaeon]|nr:HsdR family type I site-specific deoxyribonuclease [Candidatus Bathyarchaeia archaeon]